jgi:hypothetical protein
MKPWCDNPTCTYNGEHEHFVTRHDIPLPDEIVSSAGWGVVSTDTLTAWNDPGPPPADLDGEPTKCDTCWGTGSVPSTTCACPDCDAHRTRVQCDDCDGAGVITPMTTAEWEAYAARVRHGEGLPPLDLPVISVERGGVRFPSGPSR